jgi:pimeloyl-ACP methyl ester carboxylesterase
MATIWYIHGAGASENSFNWLRAQLPSHRACFLHYSTTDPASDSINRLVARIEREREPVTVIGHSLGGVIARACAAETRFVDRLVTMCAPFGGIRHAAMMAMFSPSPLYRDLSEYSPLLIDVRRSRLAVPHLAIVASNGLPVSSETNDGVVTLSSQTAIQGQDYINFGLNHFEVLLSPQVAETINDFLNT